MDNETINRLNRINRDFYAQTAQPFSQTRGSAWSGWVRLLDHLPDANPLTVLDAGCGNGRFGVFLAGRLERNIHYSGWDNNAPLLADAASSLNPLGNITAHLQERDMIESHIQTTAHYDLVTLFGVIHHIPGSEHRKAFMRSLAGCVKPGGVLAFAAWRFYEVERLRKRIIAWADDLREKVERHDYLLDWRQGTHALRYCHYVDESEHAGLIAATGLNHVSTYEADGATGTMNRYSILQKPRKAD